MCMFSGASGSVQQVTSHDRQDSAQFFKPIPGEDISAKNFMTKAMFRNMFFAASEAKRVRGGQNTKSNTSSQTGTTAAARGGKSLLTDTSGRAKKTLLGT